MLFKAGQTFIIIHSLPANLLRVEQQDSDFSSERENKAELGGVTIGAVTPAPSLPTTVVKSSSPVCVEASSSTDYDERRFHVIQAHDGQLKTQQEADVPHVGRSQTVFPGSTKTEYSGSCPICGDKISGK